MYVSMYLCIYVSMYLSSMYVSMYLCIYLSMYKLYRVRDLFDCGSNFDDGSN